MHHAALLSEPLHSCDDLHRLEHLRHAIEHAAHLLPTQGPITVFVHHNTLHAFEHLPFEEAVKRGAEAYGCQPYLSEERYRSELARERILPADLSAVLMEDLGETAEMLIGFMGTRFHLRLAMLDNSLQTGPDAEIRWLISETDALFRFRPETTDDIRRQTIASTRQWITSEMETSSRGESRLGPLLEELQNQFDISQSTTWSDATWEAFTLHLLWSICRDGTQCVPRSCRTAPLGIRHRDLLRQATGRDCDELVSSVLIRFCAAFLDQGFSSWPLPDRDAGFFAAFATLYKTTRSDDVWLKGLPSELRRIHNAGLSPLESIAESLAMLGVALDEQQEYITQTLLALRGWAGMICQMETNAEWAVRPAPAGTLVEFLAIRLILDRLSARAVFREVFGYDWPLDRVRVWLAEHALRPSEASHQQRSHLVFQLAQVRGWNPRDLQSQSQEARNRLVQEIEAFDEHERRRIYHLAYERRYRIRTLDALQIHQSRQQRPTAKAFQLVTCIDEREESLRRHVEEIDPRFETFGFAGFYGVAMYYRGATEAHYRPLCPVNVKPRHFVLEEPVYSLRVASLRQAEARRRVGRFLHQIHIGTRTFLGGALTGLLGSIATFPLVLRVLAPRTMSRLRRVFQRIVTPPSTQLRLERVSADPGEQDDQLGYSRQEMANIVEAVLKSIGLTEDFTPLVFIAGHGSSSLNNPHEAAHDCGACGGGRGGPNARAFAQMANDPHVRQLLAERNLVIPDGVAFVGSYHNTCDDHIEYYDLDRLPVTHRPAFPQAQAALDEARRRDAHERCRRFDSASPALAADAALRHVEGRSEDLSQVRPEYGHATNAVCIVGRRSRTQGLYLDRRTFLTSYDPTQDDERQTILANILSAVIPVCAGISLEYYFSVVDPTGYGCGTKLPHNITSLLGVMDGAASDLRPGLPWQMVEIHEPVRILFIIETTPEKMLHIIGGNATIEQLVRNEWVQLATLDPLSSQVHFFRKGRFEPYVAESSSLPQVTSSIEWYGGQRDHLGYAQIVPARLRGAPQ